MKTKYLLVPFSYIFHPSFISIYGSVLFFLYSGSVYALPEVYITFVQISILTFLLPLSFYLLLKVLKKVDSFTEATLEERKLPIFIQILLLYTLLKCSVLETHFPELFKFFQAGLVSSFLVFLSVMLRFKASLHMLGITALLVFVVMFTSYFEVKALNTITFLILCTGFVASSRLYMKAHTPMELIVGIFIGGVPQILVWFYSL